MDLADPAHAGNSLFMNIIATNPLIPNRWLISCAFGIGGNWLRFLTDALWNLHL